MRYLIVLDPNTVAGSAYAAGSNDGMARDCPVIDCSSIDIAGAYMSCIRDTAHKGGSDQTLWIPHHAIAYVLGYAKDETRPIGF